MIGFLKNTKTETNAEGAAPPNSKPETEPDIQTTSDPVLREARQEAYWTRRELLTLSDALAGELEGTVGQVKEDGEKANAASNDLAAAIAKVHELAEILEKDASETSSNAEEMSEVATTLDASSNVISDKVGRALSQTETAVRKMEEANAVVQNLSQASSRIGDIVKLIQDIANQTNLLALNATIEAARAGEAGRGFAVVANEVKALAGQTADATTEISEQINEIQSVTDSAVSALSEIGDAIGNVETNSNEVSQAVEEQHSAIANIGRIAGETVSITGRLTESVDQIASKSRDAETLSESQQATASAMAEGIAALGQRLNVAIDATRQANRKSSSGIPFDLTASAQTSSGHAPCQVSDLSSDSAVLAIDNNSLEQGSHVGLDIPALGKLDATVDGKTSNGYRIKIVSTAESSKSIEDFASQGIAPDQPVIANAMDAAESIRKLFQGAVDEGELSLQDFFDEDYKHVEGSNPPQHLTRFTAFTDRVLPDVQEPTMDSHDAIIFCAAVDRNGYLPTHNLKYCHPQKPDDPVWNAANCRNHRIFDDRTGLAAGQNTDPFLVQSYLRDMGGGNYVLMKDLSVPVYINGKHWGGVRVGYKM